LGVEPPQPKLVLAYLCSTAGQQRSAISHLTTKLLQSLVIVRTLNGSALLPVVGIINNDDYDDDYYY